MKLLVFAHTPPPHHGQSYMVKLMLDGFGGDCRREPRSAECEMLNDEFQTTAPDHSKFKIQNSKFPIECFHVNSRFSDAMDEIGEMRWSKAGLLLRYCAEALWCRFRHGANYFYYVPAPGKRLALYRDWAVMLLCRPFFKKTIFHWHATGLGDWLCAEGWPIERWITRTLMDGPALSVALAISSMRDALWFQSWQVEIVPNGIPDPCPDFDENVLPRRRARLEARRALLEGGSPAKADARRAGGDPQLFKVLFVAHCTRDKGLFDALESVALANKSLRDSSSRLRVHLTVAGAFMHADEEAEFQRRIEQPDLGADAISYVGFVSGETKWKLFCESDCFCFPTYYAAEGQPVSLLEAMACGLAIVTTSWRAIPEILPPEYPGFVPPRAPQQIAAAFQSLFKRDGAAALRARFLSQFTERRCLASLESALRELI